MYRLNTPQLLTLWSRLEACYYGKDSYGGDTAEIYQYTLLPYSPSIGNVIDGKIKSGMQYDTAQERFKDACEALHNVLAYFIESKAIDEKRPGVRVSIEEKEFGRWVAEIGQFHRLHIKVENLRS